MLKLSLLFRMLSSIPSLCVVTDLIEYIMRAICLLFIREATVAASLSFVQWHALKKCVFMFVAVEKYIRIVFFLCRFCLLG